MNGKHTKETPDCCEHCDKKFCSSAARREHVRRKHEQVVKTHNCDTCDYSCATAQALQIHKRKHTGEKPLKCPRCTKCFKQKVQLNRHINKAHTTKEDEGNPGKRSWAKM